MFYSRASEALFQFVRLSMAGSVAFGTYPSKTAVGGIIKKCGIIKKFIWLHRLFLEARLLLAQSLSMIEHESYH